MCRIKQLQYSRCGGLELWGGEISIIGDMPVIVRKCNSTDRTMVSLFGLAPLQAWHTQ